MKQRYIINMQDIDNLDNLQIEVAPFTIFTGDNNSGKSTVMNVVYGIFTLSKEIIKMEIRILKNILYVWSI